MSAHATGKTAVSEYEIYQHWKAKDKVNLVPTAFRQASRLRHPHHHWRYRSCSMEERHRISDPQNNPIYLFIHFLDFAHPQKQIPWENNCQGTFSSKLGKYQFRNIKRNSIVHYLDDFNTSITWNTDLNRHHQPSESIKHIGSTRI